MQYRNGPTTLKFIIGKSLVSFEKSAGAIFIDGALWYPWGGRSLELVEIAEACWSIDVFKRRVKEKEDGRESIKV